VKLKLRKKLQSAIPNLKLAQRSSQVHASTRKESAQLSSGSCNLAQRRKLKLKLRKKLQSAICICNLQ